MKLILLLEHMKGNLSKSDIEDVVSPIISIIPYQKDPSVKGMIAELLLLYIDAGLIDLKEGRNTIIDSLISLTTLPNDVISNDTPFLLVSENQAVSASISRLLKQNCLYY